MSKEPGQADILRYASLIAHQLQSPIGAVMTILKTLSGEFAGPLTARQKDFIDRANARCDESMATVKRMLAIVSAMAGDTKSDGVTDLGPIIQWIQQHYQEEVLRRDIDLTVHVEVEQATVRGARAALGEVIEALVHNAFKYTPDHGRIRVTASAGEAEGFLSLSVADSGVGIPEKDRAKVLEPFYRGAAGESARPGTGLGLSFVKAVVDAIGGSVRAEKADLGGAEIVLSLPTAEPAEQARGAGGKKSDALKVVIVGGVAAGPKIASKVIRLIPDANVTILEMGEFLSYAGCGLPYYISGVVRHQAELMSTPAGVVRDTVFFSKTRNLDVFSHAEAIEIDRSKKRVRVRGLDDGRDFFLQYDKLALATGASPVLLDVPGAQLRNIFSLHGVRDAEGIRSMLIGSKARDIVIVGGGLLGMVMASPLVSSGGRVTIVETASRTLGNLDGEVARLVELYLESKGVKVLTDTTIEAFEGSDGHVAAVRTNRGSLPAEMVVMGIGVRPNVALAEAAGLKLGPTGAIEVDDGMRTSDPDIYAAGDCVQATHLLTGRPCYSPMGSTANKQGRVAAVNLCGGQDRFPGVLESNVCEVFEYCVARTGLTEAAANELGYETVCVLTPAPDKAHYLPGARPILLKLVVDAQTHRVLGAQAVGPGGCDKRIDVAAMAITGGMTVHQLANADLCYAPPYAEAMDNIITAANVARNKLAGHLIGATPMEVHEMLEQKKDFLLLDIRNPSEHERVRLPGAQLVPLCTLRGRLGELPRDKEIVTFSQISLRGYEAALILRSEGFENVRVLDGGVEMWPFEKIQ